MEIFYNREVMIEMTSMLGGNKKPDILFDILLQKESR